MTPCELAVSCIPGIVAGIISGLFGSGWLGPRHQAWLKHRMDAENARAVFRNFLSPIINKIEATNANLLAIQSNCKELLKWEDIDKHASEVRIYIADKGVFDASLTACKRVSFIEYKDVGGNEKAKAEILTRLRRVLKLAA